MIQPIRSVYNKRLSFLDSLSAVYKEQGYKTLVNGRDNLLLVFDSSTNIDEIKKELERSYVKSEVR